jgi:hypothetical protein
MDTWSPSACSVIAMTELLNAYGYHHKVKDILHVEASFTNPVVLTADSGLQYPAGIARVMGHFGFIATQFDHATLPQILKIANAGTPVLVNFPPQTWTGGHFLIVVGGDTQTVRLVDSSDLNMQSMAASRFLYYWQGLADVFAPTKYSVMGPPTVSVAFINQVLSYYHSPAAGKGQALYDLGVRFDINPAFALAFFGHESTFGTQGEARTTLSLGNLRCILDRPCVDQDRGGYTQASSWEDGFYLFYRLIAGSYYTARGLVTPDQIAPIWAPPGDNNNDCAYIQALKKSFDRANAGLVDIENFQITSC